MKLCLFSTPFFYPFGSIMPNSAQNLNHGGYRYGFNTQKSDAEITGAWGSHYTAEHWMYDARLGRRWNTDPVPAEWESPYAVNRNNPILYSDPNGDIPIGAWLKTAGQNIKNFVRTKILGKTATVGKRSVPKPKPGPGPQKTGYNGPKGDWRGLANLFRSGIGNTAPTGRMVNIGFDDTESVSGTLSSQGNPIDRTQRFNFGNVISDHPKNKITGVQFSADASGDGSIAWLGFFNVKGLTGNGRGWSIANSGLQNIIPTWSDPMSVDYMEGRSGIIPGLNLLPTALVNYAGDKQGVLGGLLGGTMAWTGNVFNRINPALGRITSLEVQYRSLTNTQAAFTLQYKARVWQKYDENKSPFIRAWHRLWYGYD
ncbi:MAG: hypothetical protein HS119_08965 [Flavobacteriales bacterium]|nr:hypothetical protein [Flavobacteriales bacterium]